MEAYVSRIWYFPTAFNIRAVEAVRTYQVLVTALFNVKGKVVLVLN
jgi:hypothetical protein